MSFTFGKKLASGILMGLGLSVAVSGVASAADLIVGVSWANFQEERWKTDEAAMKSVIEKMGAKYISADAQSSNEKQIADIESLITRGANALIVLAWDSEAVLPGIAKAKAEGIPVVGYDRLIEQPGVFYLTFDNKEVGTHPGPRGLQGPAQGQLRLHQGLCGRPECRLPACRSA